MLEVPSDLVQHTPGDDSGWRFAIYNRFHGNPFDLHVEEQCGSHNLVNVIVRFGCHRASVCIGISNVFLLVTQLVSG